jgi:hypothetical protein
MFVSQIFWPDSLLDSENRGSYFLIGWNVQSFHCCVVGFVATTDISFDELNILLSKNDFIVTSEGCSKDGNSPIILGEYIPSSITGSHCPLARYQEAGIWITLTKHEYNNINPKIELHSLYSCGCVYHTSCYMIQHNTTSMKSTKQSYLSLFELKTASSTCPSWLPAHNLNVDHNDRMDLTATDLHFTCNQMNTSGVITLLLRYHLSRRSRRQTSDCDSQHYDNQIYLAAGNGCGMDSRKSDDGVHDSMQQLQQYLKP